MTDTEISQMLLTAQVGRLGLCKNDRPYVVPLNFAYENGHLYFHCADTGSKIEFLKGNCSVCFEIDEYVATIVEPIPCNCSAAYRSVIAFGTAEFLTDLQQKTAALRMIVAKYAGNQIAEKLGVRTLDKCRSSHGSRTIVVDVKIEWVTGKHHGVKR
jgi:nitroimidazol reductase NimA-like FMN-containing flavoprotein (pyridoxamine 5'-phosphate oxidase superfamily)